MRSEALLLYFTLLQIAGAGFPEDSEPISISHGNYTKQYPAFVGHKPGRNNTQRHKLDIQLIMIMNRTLYIAARDHIYTVDTDTANSEEIFFSKKMTWKSRQGDVDTCRMKGKHKDECHNFIKVLLQQNEDTLFVCGTNAFNPSCRTYKIDTLEAQGEEISGMARCPYDAKHANVALFADGKLYSATVTDFLAIDAVIYRSLGDSPTLRTVKHDSKWLKEPYFVQAVNYGDFIYFFFREIAMEYNTMGKVVFPRVARVCKNDRGGSPRVLEKQWTSFLKSRLNCSIPGDSHFYFNILQAVTDVIHINGRDVVMATFSTPYNSIPGSAVCAYDMAEVANTFTGRFKEQKSPDSTWTPFPEEKVPKPRPGNCAGTPPMERYKVSNEFPDDTLNFIKMHPLMDEAVPSIANRPWFLKTMVRYRLTRIVVDNEAGPYKNHTVVFLGSEKGIILKFLAKMNNGFLNESLFLEELSVYNPDKCSIDGVEDKRIVGIQIDSKSHALWVAFTSCVVKVPLSRCERHGRCKKSCIASRDPYCGWVPEGACRQVVGNTKSAFEQDVEHGNTDGLGDCQNTFVALNGHHHHRHHHTLSLPTSALPEAADGPLGRGRMVERKDPPMSSDKGEDPYMAVPSQTQPEANGVIRESYQKGRDQLVPVTLLAIAVILAFAMGAIFSGIIVYCVCDHRRRDMDLTGRKEKDTHHLHSRRGSMNSVTKLTGLFETQAKEGRPEAILTPLMHNGRLTPNGKMLIKADQHHLDLAALPTPESTPMQPRRKPSRGSREWERNQNLINACTKDMPPMGSPVISTDLPLRASPGHIPSVVVLPLQQHQHQLQPHLQQHQQSYQHEYVEQPHHSDMSMGHGVLDDQGATLEYKTSKSPCHNLNMADPDVVLPPRVPQREASLTIPPAVPQMGKRLEVHSSVYGLRKGSASGACGSSALKKHNTNSSNSSHLARHHSFNRVETPPPAPQRVDSIQMTAQGISLSRQPGMSSYGSLPRTGVKYLKPDVPPKPSVVSLSTKVKSSDSGT
ncbi:semaphorin-6A isoform X2 [Maylandia zebra]|uniref:Semaphorin-6A n=4 Tax=Haplochromini TaxID=319058 RepID=A0A9Y3RFM6_9CICH|nr:semaphorin-6A isoform X2 [Maylandia zebra]XP_005741837.1 PREDICTED: semaphorin-6A isoform X2 [Pundamilia nyererei]XP_026044099.1 semaphorin-6A isoform X2 [Astatotilapia calliptera]